MSDGTPTSTSNKRTGRQYCSDTYVDRQGRQSNLECFVSQIAPTAGNTGGFLYSPHLCHSRLGKYHKEDSGNRVDCVWTFRSHFVYRIPNS